MDGFINLLKPPGMTSSDAVMAVRRLLPRKTAVGHGGTLDPDAAGVLPICVGKATRLFDYIIDKQKEYIAELRLGIVAGDRYAALSENGQLLSCDIHSAVTFTAQLRIANCVDDEIVVAAARDFGVDHPGCTASVADIPEDTNLLSELKAHPWRLLWKK